MEVEVGGVVQTSARLVIGGSGARLERCVADDFVLCDVVWLVSVFCVMLGLGELVVESAGACGT